MIKTEKVSKIVLFRVLTLHLLYAIYTAIFDAYNPSISNTYSSLISCGNNSMIVIVMNKKEQGLDRYLLWVLITILTVFLFKQLLDKKYKQKTDLVNQK